MTPITALGVALPEPADVLALAAQVGLPESEVSRLVDGGLAQVPVASTSVTDLAMESLDRAQDAGWDPRSCSTAIYAHSLELTAAELESILDGVRTRCPRLRRAPIAVTGRPCSIFHLGVALGIESLIDGDDGSTVAVLGADAAANHDDRFFFGSAMGDAAVAIVLGGECRYGSVLSTMSSTHLVACDGALSAPDDIARFRLENPSAIRSTISSALSAAGLDWHDLAAIVPHTPYRAIWDTVATLCRFPRDRIFDDGVARTGHLNSNDVIVHYAAAIEDGRIDAGDVVALVSPGFGGTRGCTVIRR